MTELETKLLGQAAAMHDKIFPCTATNEFEQCFTRDEGKLCFWYNTADQSTHMVVADLGRYAENMPN